MAKRTPSELENFWQYLRERESERGPYTDSDLTPAGCGYGALAYVVVAGLIASAVGSLPLTIMMGLGAIPGSLVFGVFFTKWLNGRASPDRRRRLEFFRQIHALLQAKSRPKLVQSIDPVAGQLAEAGAYYWAAIRDSLNTPHWSSKTLPDGFVQLRREALEAANHAMDDLAIYVVTCMGKPDGSRKQDLKEMGQMLGNLEWDSALRNLAKITSDNDRYYHQSPNLPVIFEQAKDLATKLQALHVEILGATQQLQSAQATLGLTSEASARLDTLIHNLQATRIAEAELNEESNPQRF